MTDSIKNLDETEQAKLNETTETKRVEGKIIKVSDEGWGFISSRDIKFTRIFCHWTALLQNTKNFTELKMGMRVEFTPISIPEKGVRAVKINVLD